MCAWAIWFTVMNARKLKETDRESVSVAFNGSLQTLDRIHEILCCMSKYAANGHIVGWKANLKELFKEAQGFLTTAERETAWKKWRKIELCPIVIKDDVAKWDASLETALDELDFWLRLKLHTHKVTMASKKEWQHGLQKLAKKYDLDYQDAD